MECGNRNTQFLIFEFLLTKPKYLKLYVKMHIFDLFSGNNTFGKIFPRCIIIQNVFLLLSIILTFYIPEVTLQHI